MITLENGTRLRFRRLDARNLIIEKQVKRNWRTLGYYRDVEALAGALLQYELEPREAEGIAPAINGLAEAVEVRGRLLAEQIGMVINSEADTETA